MTFIQRSDVTVGGTCIPITDKTSVVHFVSYLRYKYLK